MVLVSLDFNKESRLTPYVKKHNIESQVIYFDEKDPNSWIPKISDIWTGSIPATLIVNKTQDFNEFYEKSFHSVKELEVLLPM